MKFQEILIRDMESTNGQLKTGLFLCDKDMDADRLGNIFRRWVDIFFHLLLILGNYMEFNEN